MLQDKNRKENDWDKVMKETRGAWCEHPIFKEMNDAVEIVNWMRRWYENDARKR